MKRLVLILIVVSLVSCQYTYQPKAQETARAYMIKNFNKYPGYTPIEFYPLNAYEINSKNDSSLAEGKTRSAWMMSHVFKEKDKYGHLYLTSRTFILNASCDSVMNCF